MQLLVNFKDVPDALLRMFDIDALYVERAPYYRWFIGLQVDAGMLEYDPVVTLLQAEHFQSEALRMATTEIDHALLTSPAAKVAAILGRFGMSKEGVWFYNPILHRSNLGYAELVGIKIMFDYIGSGYGERDWFTPDFQLKLLTRMIQMEPKNLRLAFEELYFGSDSAGWMNASERTGSIEAIKEAISPQARAGLAHIWKAAGGKRNQFAKLWSDYVEQMLDILIMVAEKAHQTDVRMGRPAYETILQGLHIGHNVDEIYTWAVDQYTRIEDEMNRLAALAGFANWRDYWDSIDPGAEMSDEQLLAYYRYEVELLIGLFRENGIIPPQPENYIWQMMITPAENRQSIPTAMYMQAPYYTDTPGDKRTGSFYVTPAGGDKTLLRAHRIEGRQTAAHELLGHGWCNAYEPMTVPSSYSAIRQAALPANEGVTVTMESAYMRCNGVVPSLQEMMAALKSLAWRCARVIAEVEWHVDNKPLEQITAEYAIRAGLSSEVAVRDIRRATTQVWEFLAYAFGASGVEALGKYMGGTLKALRYMIEQCAGLVPQNLAAWAEGLVDEPEDFDWLVDFELVDISQQLFSSDTRGHARQRWIM